MIELFIKEFCNKYGLIPNDKRTKRRYAFVEVYDNRNRLKSDFVITRNALPKGTLPGDRIEFIKS